MKKVKILPAIIHFNQPQEAEDIYLKFLEDGFEDVILCDNGSDKTKPSKYTNLLVEKNNFLRGGIMEAFSFTEENYDFEYIFYTTTSLFYHKHINYKKMLEKAIEDAEKRELNVAFFEFFDEQAIKKHDRKCLQFKTGISLIKGGEGTHACLRRDFYDLLKTRKKAYFEPHFAKDWGMDWEAAYNAFINDYVILRINDAKVIRDSITPYKKNLRGETHEEYRRIAMGQFQSYYNDKFGSIARFEFILNSLYMGACYKNRKKIKGYKHPRINTLLRTLKEEFCL